MGTDTDRCMIVSFRDEWLRAFFVEDRQSRHIPPDLESRLFRKLQMIDDATFRSGFAGAAKQSFREAPRQSGGLPFDPRQQSVAAGLPVGWQPR